MAAGGANATISVALANGYSFSQVRSSNASVAQFAVGGGAGGLSVSAISGAAGTTQLQLIDYNGKLTDQVTVTVNTTAKLTTTKGWTGAAPLVLEGSTQIFHVTTVDAQGNTLLGTGSVAFDVAAPLEKAAAITFGDEQGFTGHAGAGAITASAPATSVSQPITIVPLSALTNLAATVQANTTDSSGTYANVDVVANSAAGTVYGASCGWTISDPSVTVNSQVAASLESPARASTKLLLGKPGTFSATCVIGAVWTTVTLHR
jgi:hypothetical protein